MRRQVWRQPKCCFDCTGAVEMEVGGRFDCTGAVEMQGGGRFAAKAAGS